MHRYYEDDYEDEYNQRYDIPGFLKSRDRDRIVENLIEQLVQDIIELQQYKFHRNYSSTRYQSASLISNNVRVSFAVGKTYSSCTTSYFSLEVSCDECYCSDQSVRKKGHCTCWGNEDCNNEKECYGCTGRCNHKDAKCKCSPLSEYLENNNTVKQIKFIIELWKSYAKRYDEIVKQEREKLEIVRKLKNTGQITSDTNT